jgi:hypothetical protein
MQFFGTCRYDGRRRIQLQVRLLQYAWLMAMEGRLFLFLSLTLQKTKDTSWLGDVRCNTRLAAGCTQLLVN